MASSLTQHHGGSGAATAREDGSARLLTVADLTVEIGEQTILSSVSVTLDRGEFIAIVGESGSGKSTLVNSILRLLPEKFHATGTVTFGDADLLALNRREIGKIRGKRIGYVPQDPGIALNPVRTIGFQIEEVFRLHSRGLARTEIRTRAIELLNRVGIDDPARRLRQYPHELSGGQKQRVLIAIAFALSPELLIADEPTSALDSTVQRQVLEVFVGLARENGTTVLFITHDLPLATDYAERLIVLKDGRIVEDGRAQQVVVAPRDPYTRFLLHGLGGKESAPAISGSDAAPAIAVTHLSKAFRARGRGAGVINAVRDISFTVPSGSVFALVGESGSGKSTTARLVLGLQEPTHGTITVDGQPVNRTGVGRRQDLWRHIQLVHQNPYASLNPRSSVSSIVSAPLRAHRIGTRAQRAERVRELLESVALPQKLDDRRPAELSGGQRQRVAIARALALTPKIIVLDEPLSALDAVTQTRVLALLRDLQRDLGLTYLLISHDLAIVREFANSVAVLHHGRLVEYGAADRVLVAPQAEETKALVGAEPGARALRWLDDAQG